MNLAIKKYRMSLLTQMVLLISIVVLASMVLASALFTIMIDDILTKYIGQQAMTVAKLTAMDERIVRAFEEENPSRVIQPIAETIRKETGASYVVIGNKEGIRLSHYNPEYIGQLMGTSNDPVFKERKSVIYEGVGISGPAIKAKTPIFNKQGEIIGVSSVGYLFDDIGKTISEYKLNIIKLSLLLLTVGVIGAFLIARRVKRLIFGLEPEEISFLFKEKEATLESIREAIVAADLNGRVVSMNRRARELLQNNQLSIGGKLEHLRLRETMKAVVGTGQSHGNQKIFLGGSQVYVMHASPILQDDQVKGVVFTFRTESEIEQLTDEFSKIKAFSENMRAQNHEYLNKLNTIYGLLALQHYDKAMELISDEVKERQDMIAFLMTSVKDPLIAACLLGKINRSKELKVALEIDPESNLNHLPPPEVTKSLVTILGNIIDNGMEAAREKRGLLAMVRISFTDLGRDIVFDIEDNGAGIPREQEARIFIDGYTTKSGENRGMGLAIVKHALESLKGQIYLAESQLGGARFTIVIPKT